MKNRTFSFNYLEFDGLDLELFLCSEVLKLRSLHYGYWNHNQKPTLHNLRKSQQRYTDTLLTLIPPHVKKVLDVGCGIGDIAHALVHRGYVVSAISPDKNHAKYFANQNGNPSFIHTSFEEFTSTQQYDLILMSESQNYFHANAGFQQCRRYLNLHGYLLVSGMFRKGAGELFQDVINVEGEYLQKAHEYGFGSLKRIDITKRVLPTLVLVHNAMREHIEPVRVMIDHYLTSTAPVKTTFLRWLLWNQIQSGRDIFRYYQDRTNPSLFEDKCRYLRLLFQLA
jgi:MPBQ/MSBQ methyltransferase